MSKKFIPLILGSGREGRQSEKVAKFVFELMKNFDIETEFVDVRDYAGLQTVAPWMPGEKAEKWRQIAARADGFLIVSPEYSHSYPGELKILLDSALDEYTDKPVGLVAASKDGFDGVRLVENILHVFNALRLVFVGAVNVSYVESFVGDDYKERMENLIKVIIR